MESLSGKPSVVVMQTGKNWVSDYLSLFFGSPSFQKNIRVLGKLFSQHLREKNIAHQDDGLEARRTISFE